MSTKAPRNTGRWVERGVMGGEGRGGGEGEGGGADVKTKKIHKLSHICFADVDPEVNVQIMD